MIKIFAIIILVIAFIGILVYEFKIKPSTKNKEDSNKDTTIKEEYHNIPSSDVRPNYPSMFDYCYDDILNFVTSRSNENDLKDAIATSMSLDDLIDKSEDIIAAELKESIEKRMFPTAIFEEDLSDEMRLKYCNDVVSYIVCLSLNNTYWRLFLSKVQANIKAGENIENEEVEYQKKFGQEPSSDPVLHPDKPIYTSNDPDYKDEYSNDQIIDSENNSTINKLIDMNVAELYDQDNI